MDTDNKGVRRLAPLQPMGKRPETHFHPCSSVSIRGFSNSIAEVRFIGAEGKSGGGPPHSKTLARSRGCRNNAKRIGVRMLGRFEGGWWGAVKRQKLKWGPEAGDGGLACGKPGRGRKRCRGCALPPQSMTRLGSQRRRARRSWQTATRPAARKKLWVRWAWMGL